VAPAGAAGTGGAGGTANSAKLDSFLLAPADIGGIMGDPNMQPAGGSAQVRGSSGTLSKADCIGAYEPIEDAAYQGAAGFVAARGQAV
jgi:serine/threonine kinase PknH